MRGLVWLIPAYLQLLLVSRVEINLSRSSWLCNTASVTHPTKTRAFGTIRPLLSSSSPRKPLSLGMSALDSYFRSQALEDLRRKVYLREQFRTVKLTKFLGLTLYGTWNFVEEGHYSDSNSKFKALILESIGNETHHHVEIVSNRDEVPLVTLPFSDCGDLEIRVSGERKVLWHNSGQNAFVKSCQYDVARGMATNLTLYFVTPKADVWIQINVEMSYEAYLKLTASRAVTTQNGDQVDDGLIVEKAPAKKAACRYPGDGPLFNTDEACSWMLKHISCDAAVEIYQVGALVKEMSSDLQALSPLLSSSSIGMPALESCLVAYRRHN